jgi:ubiquinone/menaquinone biosynthesis C-methylase UbiE
LATIRAASEQLANCCFEWGDAHSIARGNESVDALIASRLFTILSDPRRAITEMHRVLHSGGRCFIAEPRPHPLARIPLNLMWTAASVATITDRGHGRYREPGEPRLLEPHEFTRLIATQPWDNIRVWTDHRYQYAVCTKA